MNISKGFRSLGRSLRMIPQHLYETVSDFVNVDPKIVRKLKPKDIKCSGLTYTSHEFKNLDPKTQKYVKKLCAFKRVGHGRSRSHTSSFNNNSIKNKKMSKDVNNIVNPIIAKVLNENIQKKENNASFKGKLSRLSRRRNKL